MHWLVCPRKRGVILGVAGITGMIVFNLRRFRPALTHPPRPPELDRQGNKSAGNLIKVGG